LTPHQQANKAMARDSIPQPGDQGIWVTCARHQERRAIGEVLRLFEEVRRRLPSPSLPLLHLPSNVERRKDKPPTNFTEALMMHVLTIRAEQL